MKNLGCLETDKFLYEIIHSFVCKSMSIASNRCSNSSILQSLYSKNGLPVTADILVTNCFFRKGIFLPYRLPDSLLDFLLDFFLDSFLDCLVKKLTRSFLLNFEYPLISCFLA